MRLRSIFFLYVGYLFVYCKEEQHFNSLCYVVGCLVVQPEDACVLM